VPNQEQEYSSVDRLHAPAIPLRYACVANHTDLSALLPAELAMLDLTTPNSTATLRQCADKSFHAASLCRRPLSIKRWRPW
jgi:hypothetical protein